MRSLLSTSTLYHPAVILSIGFRKFFQKNLRRLF
nr:MAG TPA: hypothetical protein [Caudoviricetes sp.]